MKSTVRSTSQLAKLLGISRWTVSRALNGHPGISPRTVQRIQEAARVHGFSPSMLGRGLRSGKTNLIGICLPDLVDYFLTSKISRLQDAIEARNFHPVMQMTNGSEEKESAALELFAAMHCAGVVSIASILPQSAPSYVNLASAHIPVVKIDPLHPTDRNVVASDRSYAMREALQFLHQQGHRRIVAFGIDPSAAYGTQRIQGLQAACRPLKWQFKRDILFINALSIDDDFDAGAAMAEEYLQLPKSRPSAIVALNDRIALGAMRVLQSKGVRIPDDVSVIGYDNSDFAAYATPPLTSLDPQVPELIDQAVDILLSTSRNRPAITLVKPQLVVRESAGKIQRS